MTKVCTKCSIEKQIDCYTKSSSHKDGLSYWCKNCFSIYNFAKQYPIKVEEKICRKCNLIKSKYDFSLCKANPDGLGSQCKICHKKYYENNREQTIQKQNEYVKLHPEQTYQIKRRYYERNKEQVKKRSLDRYRNNREEILLKSKNNPIISQRKKENRLKNIEHSLLKEKQWRDKRRSEKREEINLISNIWTKMKLSTDVNFRLACLLRSRINKIIKRNQKTGSAVRDLGCSVEVLKKHLEAMFAPKMTWENWGHGKGKWNIDHIIPLSAFDLSDRQHFVLACNYLNLQPMWHAKNMSKGKKITSPENMITEFPWLTNRLVTLF